MFRFAARRRSSGNLITSTRASSNARGHKFRPSFDRLEDRLAPATHIWQGPTSGGSWSTPANWTNGAPTNGEGGAIVVQFNGGISSTDDIVGLVVDQIHFTAGGDTILGSTTLGISGSTLVTNLLNDTGANTLDSTLPLNLTGANLGAAITAGSVTINGNISGSFAVTLLVGSSAGVLSLNGSNTFSGTTVIEQGTLQIGRGNALGTSSVQINDANTGISNTALLATAAMNSDNNTTFNGGAIPNNITVNNAGTGTTTIGTTSFTGNNGTGFNSTTFNGTLALNKATTLTGGNTDRTTYNNTISGPVGTLTVTGGRRTVFVHANTFVGNVNITGSGTILQLNVAGSISSASNVAVGAGTTLRVLANISINALTGSGTVSGFPAFSPVTLTIGAGGGGGAFTGTIVNGGATLGITKSGAGTETFTGANTFSGTTTVSGGTLFVNGTDASSQVNLTGGTLAGTGTVRNIVGTSGTVSPAGNGPIGTLSTAAAAVSSNLSGKTYRVDINNAADRLAIGSGATINLNGGTLTLNVVASSFGNVYTIVSSASGGISGTFNGLANGAVTTVAGHVFVVSYSSTAVTLTDEGTPGAGNATAAVGPGGVLTIKGNLAGAFITLSQPGFQQVRVNGVGSTVNGGTGGFTFSGVTSIVVNLGPGNNTLLIDCAAAPFSVAGNLTITGSSGFVHIAESGSNGNFLTVAGNLLVSLGAGNDTTIFTNLNVSGDATFQRTSDGNNVLNLNTSASNLFNSIIGALTIADGAGYDSTTLSNTKVSGATQITYGTPASIAASQSDLLSIQGSTFGGAFAFQDGNVRTLAQVQTVAGQTTFKNTVNMLFGSGNDTLSLATGGNVTLQGSSTFNGDGGTNSLNKVNGNITGSPVFSHF